VKTSTHKLDSTAGKHGGLLGYTLLEVLRTIQGQRGFFSPVAPEFQFFSGELMPRKECLAKAKPTPGDVSLTEMAQRLRDAAVQEPLSSGGYSPVVDPVVVHGGLQFSREQPRAPGHTRGKKQGCRSSIDRVSAGLFITRFGRASVSATDEQTSKRTQSVDHNCAAVRTSSTHPDAQGPHEHAQRTGGPERHPRWGAARAR